jgi:hypothetical protein
LGYLRALAAPAICAACRGRGPVSLEADRIGDLGDNAWHGPEGIGNNVGLLA